jgi:hypothetical protein
MVQVALLVLKIQVLSNVTLVMVKVTHLLHGQTAIRDNLLMVIDLEEVFQI